MSDKRYEANIIRATAVEPANNLESTSAPGVWSIDEVVELQKKSKWPTAGNVTTDVTDVFSTFVYDGDAHPKVIENGVALGNANDGGSVSFGSTVSRLDIASSADFNFGTGDFTLDYFVWWADGSQYQNIFSRGYTGSGGIVHQLSTDGTSTVYVSGGGFITNSTARAEGNWYQYCITRESGTVKLYVNGTLATTATGNDDITSSDALNIGDDDSTTGYGFNGGGQGFISNFRIIKGSAVAPPNGGYTSDLTAVSGTVLLTCQGATPFVDNSSSSHSITKVNTVTASKFGMFTGTSGKGGLVWTKARTGYDNHVLYDTARGTSVRLSANDTDGNTTDTNEVTAFNSNGYMLDSGGGFTNDSGTEYVSWTFRKQAKFFDVVTYTGNSTAGRTVSHNLGSVPGMILIKCTSNTSDWIVYHRGLSDPTGNMLQLNDTTSEIQGRWNNTAPTSTEFTINDSNNVNGNGRTFVAYLFAHNNNDGGFGPDQDGDIIKCGSFSHNASGAEVNLGFEPQWILFKAAGQTGNWYIFDAIRGIPTGGLSGDGDAGLFPNLNAVESVTTWGVDLTSTGFIVYGNNILSSGNAIYVAIRRGPLAQPTSSNNIFGVTYGFNAGTNGNTFNTNFPVDMHIYNSRGAGSHSYVLDRMRGEGQMYKTDSNNAEAHQNYNDQFDHMDGMHTSTAFNYSTWIGWSWRRAPSYFDMVGYTGTGSTRTISHNLGVAPEMMWIKMRSNTQNWAVYHKDLNGGTDPEDYALGLNDASGEFNTATYFNDTAPTSSVFTVANGNPVNGSGETYMAYLFATVAGVSKVGSYTGTGSDGNNIDCGFTSGVRFVLIKRRDSSGDWTVFDSVRGIVAGNDPYLRFNLTSAEETGYDVLDPYASGFTINNQASLNLSGATYIFYAIAT